MGSYLSLISYPKKDEVGTNIDLKSDAEKELIHVGLLSYFMSGQPSEKRALRETTSWSSRYEQAYEIWKLLPELYEDVDYGTIKYIPENEVAVYKERIVSLIKTYTADVEKLLKVGVSELEMLIDFYQSLVRQIEENTHILFSWG